MAPPFSGEDFFGVFVAYNQTVWPMQLVLSLLGVGIVVLAFRRGARAQRPIPVALGFLWLWMALVYHWTFFSEINPAARGFAGAFALEAALLGWVGLRPRPLRFRPRRDRYGFVGGALVVYALAIYPLIGLAVGHVYPAQPTFGLPCPTTIFTLGMLLWASPRVPWALLVIPVFWSFLGVSAVRYFGVLEDAVLPVAGMLGGVLILLNNRSTRRVLRPGEAAEPTTAR